METTDARKTFALELTTRGYADIQDITAAVAKVVRDSGFMAGTATIFCPSATSALTTFCNECANALNRSKAVMNVLRRITKVPKTTYHEKTDMIDIETAVKQLLS